MELGSWDTCHAELTHPQCWDDGYCDADGTCVEVSICNCVVDCLSHVGICSY
jgi:hypothetical protein